MGFLALGNFLHFIMSYMWLLFFFKGNRVQTPSVDRHSTHLNAVNQNQSMASQLVDLPQPVLVGQHQAIVGRSQTIAGQMQTIASQPQAMIRQPINLTMPEIAGQQQIVSSQTVRQQSNPLIQQQQVAQLVTSYRGFMPSGNISYQEPAIQYQMVPEQTSSSSGACGLQQTQFTIGTTGQGLSALQSGIGGQGQAQFPSGIVGFQQNQFPSGTMGQQETQIPSSTVGLQMTQIPPDTMGLTSNQIPSSTMSLTPTQIPSGMVGQKPTHPIQTGTMAQEQLNIPVSAISQQEIPIQSGTNRQQQTHLSSGTINQPQTLIPSGEVGFQRTAVHKQSQIQSIYQGHTPQFLVLNQSPASGPMVSQNIMLQPITLPTGQLFYQPVPVGNTIQQNISSMPQGLLANPQNVAISMPSNTMQNQSSVPEVGNSPTIKRLKTDSASSSPKPGCSYSVADRIQAQSSGDDILSDVQNMPGSIHEACAPTPSPVQLLNLKIKGHQDSSKMSSGSVSPTDHSASNSPFPCSSQNSSASHASHVNECSQDTIADHRNDHQSQLTISNQNSPIVISSDSDTDPTDTDEASQGNIASNKTDRQIQPSKQDTQEGNRIWSETKAGKNTFRLPLGNSPNIKIPEHLATFRASATAHVMSNCTFES